MEEKTENNTKLNRENIRHKELTSKAKMQLKPHKGEVTKDYLLMVHETKAIKDKPEWDRSQNSLTLSMIEARKNLNISEILLNEKRDEFSNFCKNRDKQIDDLIEKEKKLRESFQFFDEFVKENIEKCDRAEEKINYEKEMCEKLSIEIDNVNKRLIYLDEIKGYMITAIDNNKQFQDYLLNTSKVLPREFSPLPEKTIERYKLLLEVRNELARLQRQQIESLHETSKKIDEETDDRSEQLIDINNLFTDLYNRRQVASQEVWKWRCVLDRVTSAAAEISVETQEAQLAADELYLQVCRDDGKPSKSPNPDKNGEQLRIVLERILELRTILKVAQERYICNRSNRPNSLLSLAKKYKPKPRTRP